MKSAAVGILLLNSIGVTNADILVVCNKEPIAPMCRLSGTELTLVVEADGEKDFEADTQSAVRFAEIAGKALIAKVASKLECLRTACSAEIKLVPNCTSEESDKIRMYFELRTKKIQWQVVCETKELVRARAEWQTTFENSNLQTDGQQ